ncbi:MAG TPA: dienelactone hydrolase family protein [Acidimicrobiales bacterium]|jgi:carboxymethylenebutenolidase|nr:dienelactone hydrolase family protein [Acidimicrobiales bacterium]
MALRDYLVGEVTQDFTDGLLTRREALRRLGLLGLSVTGASALLAACGDDGDDDAATLPTSPATTAPAAGGAPADVIRFRGPNGELQAAYAEPGRTRAALLVIHENRGLTPHFHGLVRRFAGEGFAALCVDLLSAQGGTAALTDPAAAPTALSDAPDDQLLADLRAGIDELQRRVPGVKVGAVGFCFGGGMTWNLLQAGEARLAAAAPFYGPAPENADFRRAKAAVLAVYGELDARVNATRDRAKAALEAAGLPHEVRTFAGADHAFFNETGPRHNPQAASEAYQLLLQWFNRYLV